jgi:hypothetical protein
MQQVHNRGRAVSMILTGRPVGFLEAVILEDFLQLLKAMDLQVNIAFTFPLFLFFAVT